MFSDHACVGTGEDLSYSLRMAEPTRSSSFADTVAWIASAVLVVAGGAAVLSVTKPNRRMPNPVHQPSRPIDVDLPSGSLSGIVHPDSERAVNWAQMQGADAGAVEAISELEGPVAILKNMWVEEDARGQGVGGALMDAFFEEAWDAESFVLLADKSQEQLEGFDLEKWYEGYGFETVGVAGTDPVMVLAD